MLKGIGKGVKTPGQQWAHFGRMFNQRRVHSIRDASEGIPKREGAQRLESKIPHDFPMLRSAADRIMASKNVHSRSPEPVKTLPYMVKRTLQLRIRIRILEMGNYPGLSRCAQTNHLISWGRKEDSSLTLMRERHEDQRNIREVQLCCPWRWGPWVKAWGQTPEMRKMQVSEFFPKTSKWNAWTPVQWELC